MGIYDTQYRPAVTTMTSVNDAVSVAFVRDLADGVNNAKGRVMGPVLVSDAWPDASLKSSSAGTDERVLLQFAPRTVAKGYNRLVWSVSGAMEAGTSGNCTIKLYAGQGLYRGPDPVTASGLLATYLYTSKTISFTSTTPATKTNDDDFLLLPRPGSGDVFLMITTTNSVAADQLEVWSTTITAYAKDEN